MFRCTICGAEKPENEIHRLYVNVCKSCVDSTKSKAMAVRQRNDGWMKIAEENDIKIYERQPGETDTEWNIWQAYSGFYPSVKPSYSATAEVVGCSASHVKNTALRWDFHVRMQAYKTYVDELTRVQRAAAIKDMNDKHISMAQKLQRKLDSAIDQLDPAYIKPAELNSLLKTMAELEAKAHISNASDAANESAEISNVSKGDKKVLPKKEDMSEILAILGSAGMLQGKDIGIEKTERIVIKGE